MDTRVPVPEKEIAALITLEDDVFDDPHEERSPDVITAVCAIHFRNLPDHSGSCGTL